MLHFLKINRFPQKNNIQGENIQNCDFWFQEVPRIEPSALVNQPVTNIPQPILFEIPKIAPK